MAIRLSKLITQLSIILLFISCKNDAQKTTEEVKHNIDFLDKKYFHGYELDPNHRYPQFSYRDSKIGEFVIMYLAKDNQLQKEWESDHAIHDLYMGIETTKKEEVQINKLITDKLESNLNKYYIIAEYVQPKYLSKKSYNYIYPYTKTYYLYDKENKKWDVLKNKIIKEGEESITLIDELTNLVNSKSNVNELAIKNFRPSKNDNANSDFQTYVLDSTKIKANNKEFRISVLEYKINKNTEKHTALPIIIEVKNGSKYEKINENTQLVFKNEENCLIGEYSKISVKNNYFTIEQVYCKDFLYVQSYTTFKIDEKGNIFLHKYGEEYTDRSNPDKDIPTKVWTTKDFGNITFEKTNEDLLIHL